MTVSFAVPLRLFFFDLPKLNSLEGFWPLFPPPGRLFTLTVTVPLRSPNATASKLRIVNVSVPLNPAFGVYVTLAGTTWALSGLTVPLVGPSVAIALTSVRS